jgi:anti-anti-sigma regulatory factor
MTDKAAQSMALPAIVDLDSLDEIRDRLLDAVEHGSVTVGAGDVERVATNALLMLLSAAETARRSAYSFEIENLSAPMQSAIERLGLSDHFEPLCKG